MKAGQDILLQAYMHERTTIYTIAALKLVMCLAKQFKRIQQGKINSYESFFLNILTIIYDDFQQL